MQAVKLTRKSSSIDDGDTLDQKTKKKEEQKDKLHELMANEFGAEILITTNYNRLQTKILSLLFNILRKQDPLTIEEKIIIDNSLTIWVGCVLYKPELFNDFLSFKDGNETVEDFILSGLVECQEDKIRSDFCQAFSALASSLSSEMKQKA